MVRLPRRGLDKLSGAWFCGGQDCHKTITITAHTGLSVKTMSRHQGKQEERDFEGEELPSEFKLSRSKIMYIEDKSGGLEGEARIGRVYLSKSGKTLQGKFCLLPATAAYHATSHLDIRRRTPCPQPAKCTQP
jgi:hypothetical protein